MKIEKRTKEVKFVTWLMECKIWLFGFEFRILWLKWFIKTDFIASLKKVNCNCRHPYKYVWNEEDDDDFYTPEWHEALKFKSAEDFPFN